MTVALLGAAYGFTKPRNESSAGERTASYTWQLPEGFQKPKVPADNPMTTEKYIYDHERLKDPAEFMIKY